MSGEGKYCLKTAKMKVRHATKVSQELTRSEARHTAGFWVVNHATLYKMKRLLLTIVLIALVLSILGFTYIQLVDVLDWLG